MTEAELELVERLNLIIEQCTGHIEALDKAADACPLGYGGRARIRLGQVRGAVEATRDAAVSLLELVDPLPI